MAYNITNFKVITMENLAIPVKELCRDMHPRWAPARSDNGFKLVEGEIEGVFRIDGYGKEWIHVDLMDIRRAGSGNAWTCHIVPALRRSKGLLDALIAWDDGDEIERFHCLDGQITSTNLAE